MPNFNANLSLLFTELPFLDRFEAAAQSGFKGVEYLFPYEFEAADLASKLKRHGLRQVLHNLPPGDWAAGERGTASIPGREAEFREGVEHGIRYATAVGCTQLNCLAGIVPHGADVAAAGATLVENLHYADAKLAEAGIALLVEAINTRDMPGFYLNHTSQVRRLIEENGLKNTFFQYDVYHMQIMEGDLALTIKDNLDIIRHIQIADNPGRNEPGTGEINFEFLFRHLDEISYDGWIGAEYRPRGKTTDSLAWFTNIPSPSVKP